MYKAALLAAGTLLLGAAPMNAEPRLKGEAKLARALEGRVAGEPVDCINLRNVRSTQIIDDTAILYDTGRTLYVNRPNGGGQLLDQGDVLVTKTFSSQLCRIDVVRLYDSGSRMPSGFVSLGDFVPYKKVRGASSGR